MTLTITNNTQLDSLVVELKRSIEVISAADDVNYRRNANSSGSVGAQFRHILDFASALVRGFNGGLIDYSERERDVRVEMDREWAVDRFKEVIGRLSANDPEILVETVLVRSEIDTGSWFPSSIGREVEFVHSHTVHHHALIAEKLAGFGFTVKRDFGVAPSTMEFWARKAA